MFHVSLQKNSFEIISKFPYKVGIVTFMVFPELLKSDEGSADKIKVLLEDPFFDLYEVALMRDSEWEKLVGYVKQLKRPVNFALGLQPEILVRKFNPNALIEEERKKAEEVLIEGVKKAIERNIQAVALCSGPVVKEREKAIQALLKTLTKLAEVTSKHNIKLFLETFDVEWDKKRLVGPLDIASKVIEEVRRNYKNAYLMWDLSHAPLLNEKPEDLKTYADLIGHIHIGCAKKVNDKLYDWHPGFYRPGAINTEYDVAKLLEVLSDIGYKGAVSFEVKPEEGQHPLEVVHAAKSVLVRAYQIFLEGKVIK